MARVIFLLCIVCLWASCSQANPVTTITPTDETLSRTSTPVETSTPSGAEASTTATVQRTAAPTTVTSLVPEATTSELPLQQRCEAALRPWSPWTTKAENIDSDDCGVRRRNRRFHRNTDRALERTCIDDSEVELTEYKEDCKILSRHENVAVIQYYFVNEVFGNGVAVSNGNNRQLLENQEGSLQRHKRFIDGNIFSPGNSRNFITCPQDKTKRPVDFLIMLDKSGSMLYRHFRVLLKSMKFLVENGIPDVSADGTRVAMMTFANHPTVEFGFDDCTNKSCVVREIYASQFEGGLTRMAVALDKARDMFSTAHGMRECSRRVVLMVTDGSSTEYDRVSPEATADALKLEKDVEVFVVGISRLINEEQLQGIVTYPMLTHLYYVPDVRQARRVFKKIKTAMNTDL